MNTAPKFLFVLTAVAAFSIVYPASVQAVPTTYKYTGNRFTFASGPYSTRDFVTAMVTLASPLAPNTPFTQVTPLAFSMSDGVQTITLPTSFGFTFVFATGSTGEITFWSLVASGATGVILTQNPPTGAFVRDSGQVARFVGVVDGSPT
jgi:hypothetical protein